MTDIADLCLHRSNYIDRFKKNFVKSALCELRFPTVLEFGEPKLPPSIIKALRKSYPNAEIGSEVNLGAPGPISSNMVHVMRSQKGGWAISFKQSALTLEVQSYTGYPEFRRRIQQVIDATTAAIDSDFLTRVGLRFVNVIDQGPPTDGWVNPALLGPIDAGVFKMVAEYSGRLASLTEDNGFLLQHGLRIEGGRDHPSYVLDVDAFSNNVTVDKTLEEVDALHSQVFNVFEWALGERSREYLQGAE
ncbi:TIGR04255 family protein [Stenotrophomonas maltophilia]|uniref:TIGR04255 family protein n=1 Tax=Stenotrophomonas maltophilia TaxID=40324 RepID=A0AAJ2JAX4_STEMA|nr:TIGR04255 family protein [Stenotrophomonas maltophilia]MDT3467944.1 TIGR04255 family protein [Stenotrophomonas maltophilia]